MTEERKRDLIIGMQQHMIEFERQIRHEERSFILASLRSVLPTDHKIETWRILKAIDMIEGLPYAKRIKP